MKVLVIPDVHLKPEIFDYADRILNRGDADCAVVLGDLVDDWGKDKDLALYSETMKRAAKFAAKHPDTRWCLGNHDCSYMWRRLETGYSPDAEQVVITGFSDLYGALPDERRPRYMWLIDDVLFCHGGLARFFAAEHSPDMNDAQKTVDAINKLGMSDMWTNLSPIWLRPQYIQPELRHQALYMEDSLLQVVGHTPVTEISKSGNILSCDTFSTCRDGSPYGNRTMAIVNTMTHETYVSDTMN